MTISDQDRQLFRKTVGEVKKITSDVVVHPRKKRPLRIREALPETQSFIDMMSDDDTWIDKDANLSMHYLRQGVSKRLFRELVQGKIFIDAAIDLHGLTVSMAREELSYFLFTALKQNLHCLKIIHGQGYNSPEGPVIRGFVNKWLRLNPDILAFTNAPQRLGGKGATLCLLRAQSSFNDTLSV